MELKLEGEQKVELSGHRYSNGRLAIEAREPDGSPYGKLTVNIPELDLKPGEFFVKTGQENVEFADAARKSKFFKDTKKRVKSGFIEYEVWTFAPGYSL